MNIIHALAQAQASAKAIRKYWHKQGELLGGAHVLSARGEGFQWADIRAYQYGDETKWISWKHTARSLEPYVKTFEIERAHRFSMVLDRSQSMHGGVLQNRFQRAWTVAAVIGYLILRQKDICMAFDSSHKAPRERLQVFHHDKDLTRWAIDIMRKKTHLPMPGLLHEQLGSLHETLKRHSSIIVFTDGYDDFNALFTALKLASKHHEVMIILFPDIFSATGDMHEAFQKFNFRYECMDVGTVQSRLGKSRVGKSRVVKMKDAGTQWHDFWNALRLPQVNVHLCHPTDDPMIFARKLLMKK